MTPRERADQAKQMLEMPVFRLVMHDIREQMVNKLETSALSDIESHHETALALQVLKRVETMLRRYMDEQTMVEHIDKTNRFMDRIRQKLS